MNSDRIVQSAPASPHFDNPPVFETAIGIQFEELVGFNSSHFGLYHQRVRERFPIAIDQPRLLPLMESFPRRPRSPQLHFSQGPNVERMIFKSDDGTLVQVQPDRFGFNWKRPDSPIKYPRYTEIVSRCLTELDSFRSFCSDENLGEVSPDVCEVVYVNHIRIEEGEDAIGLFEKVFTGIEWHTATPFLPKPEAVAFNRIFPIEETRGRLYAEASLASDKEGEFIQLKMTARTLCHEEESLEMTIQLAHDWVVHGFVCITDENIRRTRWGQQ